jgi:CHAT domain-containing protein
MGVMDVTFLCQEIEALAIECERRAAAAESPRDLIPHAQALEKESRRLNVPDAIVASLMRRADILLVLQHHEAAITLLEEARRTLGTLRQQDLAVDLLGRLAGAHARTPDWPAVSRYAGEGIALVEKFRYKVSSHYLQSAYLRTRIGLYAHGARAAFELKDHALMLVRAELSKCRTLLNHRPATAGAPPDKFEKEFGMVCTQIDQARANGMDVTELLAKRRTLWDLLVIQRRQNRGQAAPPEFNLQAVQAILAADEAILYYYWLDKVTLMVVGIDRTQCVTELRILQPTERTGLEALADFIHQFGPGSTKKGLDEIRSFAEVLLPAPIASVLANKRRLIVSPHRMLHALPFHALPFGNRDYLIQSMAVSYAPNLTSLLLRHGVTPERRVLAVGVMNFVGAGAKLDPLKTAEEEVTAIAEIHEANGAAVTLLRGAEATESQLQTLDQTGELGRYSCLHFATHGLNIAADTPMESHLYLRDSCLDGLEIANYRLSAELVVLSACCSGQRAFKGRGLDELPGDEMFGLPAAFFAAGARRILCTLWPVDDVAARKITPAVHRHLAAGQAPECALQLAITEYIAGEEFDNDIYFWAPFFLSVVGRSNSQPEMKSNLHGQNPLAV